MSVHPGGLTANLLPPPVLVEEVLVDGVVQSRGAAGKAASAFGASQPAKLEVPPGKRQVQFRYTGLSFISPDRVRFRYRLEGLHKDWIEAGTRREAQYSFLRPGEYRFQVTACNNEGVWNDQPAVLFLHVLPHFYETWWFVALENAGNVGGVAGVVRAAAARKYRRAQPSWSSSVERDRARIARTSTMTWGRIDAITLLSDWLVASHRPNGRPSGASDSARQMTRSHGRDRGRKPRR